MSRMSIEPVRHALNGATMGTRWSALFFVRPGFDPEPVRAALQAAVDEVDAQMSTWMPGSDLMQLNAAPVGDGSRCQKGCGRCWPWVWRSVAPRAGPSTSAWAMR